ncbi:MAG: hypothetical protein JXB32_25770 [Deltaproteobacteria bacterium]|nr:hypothetical protein [Deltaproteobacteria bacterium]
MRGVPMRSTMLAAALLAAVSGAACRKSGASAPLVSEAELQALKVKADGMLAEARARRCSRPVLRGEAVPGDAGAALREVLGGVPETRACLERLADGRNIEDLWRLDEDLPAAIRDRDGSTPRPLDTAAERAPELRETVAACAGLYERLQRAVAHAEACGPWRQGLGCVESYLPRLRLGQAVAAGAWFRLAEGKLREGLELALDGLRLLQDLERGGAAWIDAAIGAAATLALAPVVEAGLTAAAGDAELLDEAVRQLGVLLETEAHPRELLAGEYLGGVLFAADPAVLGAAAVPDGLRCRVPDYGEGRVLRGPTVGADVRDDFALNWLALDRMFDGWQGACPAGSLPLDCREGLERLYEGWRERASRNPETFLKDLLGQAVATDPHAKFRAQVLDVLLGVGSSPGRWVTTHGRRRFLLGALRLQAAWLRQAGGTGACPGVEAFEVGPLAALRTDPFAGRPIVVHPDGAGGFVFRPAESLVVGTSAESRDVAVWAACPKAAVGPGADEAASARPGCRAFWKIDSGDSYLDEVRGRLRATMNDFQTVFAAVEVGGEGQEPLEAGGAFRIADRPLLWFDGGRNAVVVDAAHFTDLQAFDVPRACLEAGKELPVGRFLSLGSGALSPRQLVEFLIRAGVLQTFWHVGSELCLRGEVETPAWYEAEFDGVNVYFTNEENRDPFAFAVRVAPDGAVTLVTR